MIKCNNAVEFQHHLWNVVLKKANIIIDATCGNGHDLLYLFKNSLKESNIYTFDIQKNALQYSRDKIFSLKEENTSRIKFIHDSHENMKNHRIPTPYDLVVFNLGYLPKGDHSITTKADSTINAIKVATANLSTIGIVTIVAYPGTDYGAYERDCIKSFLEKIPQSNFNISHWKPINQTNNPPELFIIARR